MNMETEVIGEDSPNDETIKPWKILKMNKDNGES